jgi:hypothetical protein
MHQKVRVLTCMWKSLNRFSTSSKQVPRFTFLYIFISNNIKARDSENAFTLNRAATNMKCDYISK